MLTQTKGDYARQNYGQAEEIIPRFLGFGNWVAGCYKLSEKLAVRLPISHTSRF